MKQFIHDFNILATYNFKSMSLVALKLKDGISFQPYFGIDESTPYVFVSSNSILSVEYNSHCFATERELREYMSKEIMLYPL